MTTSMNELSQILRGDHDNPHHVLGKHTIVIDNAEFTVIRVFNPAAKLVEVVDTKRTALRYKLTPEHQDGFYSVCFPEKMGNYKIIFTNRDGQTWETRDPYSFAPTLSDLDLHLFANGTHYEVFNKMGATARTIGGVKGVAFAVWAPNAKRVSVVGNFNGWDGLRHPMRRLNDTGVWEIFVPGLQNFDTYKFEIKTYANSVFQKADPYASFAELRPGTASVVYDLGGYKWGDTKWRTSRKKNSPLNGPMNVYELHAGSWKRNKNNAFVTWPELTDELVPYVKGMGYTHIELMPVMEHPFDGSWGYQVTGFYAPTSRFGNPHEFMAFVDTCHQNGIGVLLDWVPAHFPKDAFGLATFDGTCLYEHADPRQGEHPDWGTLIFNYGRNEVKNFLIANALFWLDKYHIDGLRVDAVASMLYLDYGKDSGQWVPNQHGGRENDAAIECIKHMNSIIAERYPHALMIAEESTAWPGVTRPVKDDGLGFALKWNMGWMNDFLSYMSLDSVYRKHHHHNLTFSMVYAYSEKYMLTLSHDEVVHGKKSLVDKMPGDTWQKFANLRAAYAFMMGHPGKKLLFMGGEIAQFSEWSEKQSIEWFMAERYELHRQMQMYVKDLNNLYLCEPAFWQKDFAEGGFEWISSLDHERSILSFCRVADMPRNKGTELLVFACNFTPITHLDYRVGLPAAGEYVEVFNSDATIYGGSGVVNHKTLVSEEVLCDGREYSVPIKLPPLGVLVLKRV